MMDMSAAGRYCETGIKTAFLPAKGEAELPSPQHVRSPLESTIRDPIAPV
jgi:hypothetical protein